MDIRLQNSQFAANSLHLEPGQSDSCPFFLSSGGMQRGRNLIDAGHNVGQSSSSFDIKWGSLATTSYTLSSTRLELDFSLNLFSNEKLLSNIKTFPCFVHPKVDLELSLSTGPSESDISSIKMPQFKLPEDIAAPKRSVTCTSGISNLTESQSIIIDSRNSIKKCKFEGCTKGARGASRLCIGHGGGRRCQKLGCQKGAEGKTVFCKAHGGGRRCEHLGCTKSAEGRTDFCIAHGGGRRCHHETCSRAARGKSGLCIRHGGGKRCRYEACTKSAEGLSGLCISHGGGRRCQFLNCAKGAQGSTMFCKAHGGGKRCTFSGCNKGAEGSTQLCKGHGGGKRCGFSEQGVACPKSVHGGTQFCVAHGGGKRCAFLECTKSARGRTDFCVRHGGGKRCKYLDGSCGKSAQGSTDFCKAHGGGKRCCWGKVGSGFGENDGVCCNSFARNKEGLCASHWGLVQDKRVHGGATLGSIMVHNSKDHCALVPEGRVHGGSLMALLSGSGSLAIQYKQG